MRIVVNDATYLRVEADRWSPQWISNNYDVPSNSPHSSKFDQLVPTRWARLAYK
jgi:hypothetical protein